RDGHFTSYTRSQGFPIQHRTRTVFGDREGNLWVGGSGGGLCRYRAGAFSVYSTLEALPGNLIRVIAQDREGNFTYDGDENIYRALQGGARAYLLKDIPREEFLDDIRAVYKGQYCIPPAVAAR